MDQKKPPVNWTSVAEEQIQQAQAAGEFENLPGFGRPIPGIDEPYDENWWVKEKLRREQLSALPPALEIARDKERTLADLGQLHSATAVRRELTALNERIQRAHFRCFWGPSCDTTAVEIDQAILDWRKQRAE